MLHGLMNYINLLLPSAALYATQYQNLDFNLRRDHQNKFPMSVATI